MRHIAKSCPLFPLLGSLLLLSIVPLSHAHIYVAVPQSRNAFASGPVTGRGVNGRTEYCPHCLQAGGPGPVSLRQQQQVPAAALAALGIGPLSNPYNAIMAQAGMKSSIGTYLEPDSISARHGVCGDPPQNAVGSSFYNEGQAFYPVQATVAPGGLLDVTLVASTNHLGHFEFFLCDTSTLPNPNGRINQGCFNRYPLNWEPVPGYPTTKDPQYPGRFYLPPPCTTAHTPNPTVPTGGGLVGGQKIQVRLRMPNINCPRCVIQWYYITGNNCKPVGYRAEYFNTVTQWPGCGADAWWVPGLPACGGAGANYPEEFWNCVDISIGGAPVPPTPPPHTLPPTPTTAPPPVNNNPVPDTGRKCMGGGLPNFSVQGGVVVTRANYSVGMCVNEATTRADVDGYTYRFATRVCQLQRKNAQQQLVLLGAVGAQAGLKYAC